MTIHLTPDQWHSVQEGQGSPVRVSDPSDTEAFVLLRADVYERFRSLFEDVPVTDQERQYQLQQFGNRSGWDDPEMDFYSDLDPRRTS
ncbi:MAG: hypothetical protein JWM11_4930 [Planctomycetaceae bacterium]|nr:hypothetical protein [Planctomycetaceae bacterium]